jgi:hypothetical protein
VLDGQAAEVDVAALEHLFLAGRAALDGRLHVPQRLGHLEQLAGILQAFRRVRLLQAGEHPAHITQIGQRLSAHAECDTARCPEKIGQGRGGKPGRRLEQQGRAAGPQHPVAERRHLQHRRDFLTHTLQFAEAFKAGDEVPQVAVFHNQK